MAKKRPTSGVARERLRRQSAVAVRPIREPAAASRREAARTCAWCGAPLEVKPVGRIPKWCSAACRQRAWEQTRAAASGRSAVTLVERVVIAPAPPRAPRHGEWPALLRELTSQIDHGHIYPRDLPVIITATTALITALNRRHRPRPNA